MRVELNSQSIRRNPLAKFHKTVKIEPKPIGRGPQDAMDSDQWTTDFKEMEKLVGKAVNLDVKK